MLSARSILRIFKRSKKEFREDPRSMVISPSAAEALVTTATLAP